MESVTGFRRIHAVAGGMPDTGALTMRGNAQFSIRNALHRSETLKPSTLLRESPRIAAIRRVLRASALLEPNLLLSVWPETPVFDFLLVLVLVLVLEFSGVIEDEEEDEHEDDGIPRVSGQTLLNGFGLSR